MLAPSTAYAAEPPGNTISGTITNSGEPVEGAKITVTPPSGQPMTATTDAEGSFSIHVPGNGGRMEVELDTESLPEGVELREGAKNPLTPTLLPNYDTTISFPMGADTRDVDTKLDRVPGLVYSGLLFGLIIAMAALGMNMIFGTTGLTNFAHGELVGLGALLAYFLSVPLGIPFLLAVPLTIVIAMALGWAQDRGLWRPLRKRGTNLVALMIVTIGMQLALRYLYQLLTDGKRLNYQDYLTAEGHDVAGLFTYTVRDLIIAATSIVVLLGVILALNYTRLGRATRAVSDNPALAAATGINVDRVISIVWTVGAGLAALSGVFLGFTQGVNYDIGQLVLLLLFAAVCVGGLGSIWGALVGSLIIGVLLDVSTLFIDAEVKNAGALLLLVVILLLRPQGLLGRKERIG